MPRHHTNAVNNISFAYTNGRVCLSLKVVFSSLRLWIFDIAAAVLHLRSLL